MRGIEMPRIGMPGIKSLDKTRQLVTQGVGKARLGVNVDGA